MSTESTPTLEQLQSELQKRELKIKALLEDITNTREQNADLRVEITYVTQYAQQLEGQLNEVQAQGSAPSAD